MIVMLKAVPTIKISDIILNSLSNIDSRMPNHGLNVAYIILKILEEQKGISKEKIAESCLVGMLHDIGSYEIKDINTLFGFDSDKDIRHSVTGYVILSYVSPLSNLADSVLFHHADYNKFDMFQCQNVELAQMIRVADRFDTCNFNIDLMLEHRGTRFNPDILNRLERICHKVDFHSNIESGIHIKELNKYMQSLPLTSGRLKEYLRTIIYPLGMRTQINMGKSSCVAVLASSISNLAGNSDEDTSDIYIAGSLHDIGMINQEDKMEHIRLAKDILMDNVPYRIVMLVEHHHERLDGSGLLGIDFKDLTSLDRIIIASVFMVDGLIVDITNKSLTPSKFLATAQEGYKAQAIDSSIMKVLNNNYDILIDSLLDISSDISIIQKSMAINRDHIIEELSKLDII